MDKDDEPRSLKALFADAESKRLALESSPLAPNSTEYTDAVSSAIKLYQDSSRLIDAASLFSPNESLEDLSTSDLPYLLTNFHLAELTQKLPFTSPEERKRVLSSARDAYERYLHLLDSYGLLSAPHKKFLEQYNDSPTTFTTVPSNPAARRDAKIANFKTEKELRSKLDFLRRRPDYGTEGGDGAGDEDLVRETHLAHLNYSTHQAFQSLEMLNREWEMLAQAPPRPEPIHSRGDKILQEEEDLRRRQRGLADNYSDRLDQPLRSGMPNLPGGPLFSKQGKPLQPFTLLNSRQELAKGVFRPGHNLPTMTIDEYLEEERRRGGIIEGGGEASLRREEPDEDDMEKADAETMKARAWDEFVEANPKGSGNTLNRG
ncbi:Immunoglobulin-binding protein 1 [Madurella mycetomatis]|uniref:Immunoglobulin-binding protein 1 n=1 Tax=Madurella mycetomatis TaxID=100816 RepID=A0A175W5Z0_9PEZI|nr:Immunoglobulin-binding protein 1 [Madurella mycetomatis]KXX79178.1 Immunoglobulin-binding protein 1 [Madurella mycetomatis]